MDWDAFLSRHGSALVLYARQWTLNHADAEELVQDAVIRCWRAMQEGRLTCDNPLPLVYTNIKWIGLDRIRERKRRDGRELAAGEMIYDETLFEGSQIDAERREKLGKAVAALPEEQREVVMMKIWGDLTFQVIADTLGISINTTASRYRYAMAHMKKMLKQEGIDYD
jgi:RNA polymerase sigma-70 factor (ECF subfamily)